MSEDARPRGPRAWARDLVMGGRFALAGGRQGWVRTALTAVGVGLGVAVLLFAASVPSVLHETDVREDARTSGGTGEPRSGPHSLLMADAGTTFHGKDVNGKLVEAEGNDPVKPPGVGRLPAPGEMVVSPALKKVLADDGNKELIRRLDGRIVGTIGDEGLLGPHELAFYAGADQLDPKDDAQRYSAFGGTVDEGPIGPVLLLLVVVACAVLVMPVAVFIGTAARFGGERRDQRLAALRLVGADIGMSHRMVAGESLVGAVLGLLLGGGLFLALRAAVGQVTLFGLSVFPADVVPSGPIVALIALGVPVVAVTVAQFAMRAIAVEPLGVVRESEPRPRRLWWRLAPPVIGMLLLLPLAGSAVSERGGAALDKPRIILGVVLLLGGVALLLPWVVERIVGRLRGGFPSWQLAVRRLQLGSGSATRAVSGITIAVAGAVALQILFTGASADLPGADVDRGTYMISGGTSTARQAASLQRELEHTDGVEAMVARVDVVGYTPGSQDTTVPVSVGTCAMLRKMATVGSCRDGDVFVAPRAGKPVADVRIPKPGEKVRFDTSEGAERNTFDWRVPASARDVRGRHMAEEASVEGVLATPGAFAAEKTDFPTLEGWMRVDTDDPEAVERARTALYQISPDFYVGGLVETSEREFYEGIKRAVLAAATGVLVLIGLSMIVSMMEQLRERRRQLAVLVAFGTRRSTLGASVLWQTAVPVVLGLALAVAFGSALGWVLLRMVGRPVEHWFGFLPIVAGGAAMIVVVTLVSLPPLWRLMRPDGLRTE
ncbi:ABC transporter permease [Streptomyces sp. NPDC048172]|uniref:ABC transporter permease n=1 Tax=Streptomyces sp. NPDC048172 TaxID=3365505 RepID=UPI003723E245